VGRKGTGEWGGRRGEEWGGDGVWAPPNLDEGLTPMNLQSIYCLSHRGNNLNYMQFVRIRSWEVVSVSVRFVCAGKITTV
jgi:hypothetical protein